MTQVDRLNQLAGWMAGQFSSADQARVDPGYYEVHLTVFPIWNERTDGYWLYVEQAMSFALTQPYRQRIYHLTAVNEDTFESRIAEIPNKERFIGGWNNPEVFDTLSEEELEWREGCSVFLKWNGVGFSGSTDGMKCATTFNGASYATSIVEVTEGALVSWDRGWDEQGGFVWGAWRGGYVFTKLSNYPLVQH